MKLHISIVITWSYVTSNGFSVILLNRCCISYVSLTHAFCNIIQHYTSNFNFTCDRWLELILIEFYAQGDAEKISHIPVTPMMDRNSNVPVPKFQIGFINAIVKPLFVELSMNGVTVNDPIDCINETVSL